MASTVPPPRTSQPLPRPAAAGRAAPAAPRQRRRPLVTALKGFAVTIVGALVLLGFMTLLWIRRGDVRANRRAAAAEARALLEPGERIEREVNVSQRHWYHYFREMHGVLVATDRRLLYVGVEPAALLPSREFEPQAFEERAYAWDTVTSVQRERVFFNTARGAVVRGRDGAQVVAVSGAEQDRLADVAAIVERRAATVRAQLEREREARLAAEVEARKPRYHTVRRGEALISIANLYGITPEQLREWNRLENDRIRVGQQLMVKPQT